MLSPLCNLAVGLPNVRSKYEGLRGNNWAVAKEWPVFTDRQSNIPKLGQSLHGIRGILVDVPKNGYETDASENSPSARQLKLHTIAVVGWGSWFNISILAMHHRKY